MEKKMGTVTWFNITKGYGEILSEDSQESFFFTYREIEGTGGFKTIIKGASVSFYPSDDFSWGLRIARDVKEI